ncbi:long-chain fatty acid transport protein 4-like [Neocloeon triangulifer]|uniref:long-chain fatty acid transport protein 4-like n=1 Tax=Neocloeon triangulifer TaxID=2078957 RepID=UPI00286F7A8B|nr:long-chain fatty acid transport protein 4-like [Neocloeon triangulifer]
MADIPVALWLLLPFTILVALLAVYLSRNNRYRWFYILYKTLPRDARGAIGFAKVNWRLRNWEKTNMNAVKLFHSIVKKNPNKVAFHFEDQTWTFKQVLDYSRRVASYFHNAGYKQGDVVALLSTNRPEYVAIWLGLAEIGVQAALINSNLRQLPLIHSITKAVTGCTAIIFEAGELTDAVRDIESELNGMLKLQLGAGNSNLTGAKSLDTELEKVSTKPIPGAVEKLGPKDKLVYIYTSGTTGLPKAAVITHLRFMFMSTGVNIMLRVRENDCIYTPLPLYHTAGGMLGIGSVVLCGASMAIRKKFSVTNFWTDCIKYKCTAAQYIGETCRYLLSAPVKPEDRAHSVRIMFGNGLRPQIWTKFVDRFGIKEIGEFYGATEGNSNIVNFDNTVGAVGFVPRYAGKIYPLALVKVDEETGEPIRGPNGLCIRCKIGEAGVFVGKINKKRAVNDFHGYADQKASEKKIVTNVFEKGDAYFNSGDILEMDEFGYFYFRDRTGDTFRWKGENVATSEVEAVISNVAGLNDAVVYGVQIPGAEGRAGMASIVGITTEEDLAKLAAGIKSNLPSYARPIFLRVLKELPMTGTFKLKKVDLQKEAYNMDIVKDPMYYIDQKTGQFKRLTREVYQDILDKKFKV